MQPRIHNAHTLRLVTRTLCAGTILFVTCVVGYAVPSGRVVVRDDMKASHRAELTAKLRSITGLSELTFNPDGVLEMGSPTGTGSESARILLESAVHGNQLIVLEDATDRSDVAFCRVVPGRATGAVATRILIFVVLIDFRDFEHISGDARARAAFDVGWGLLHELDHVVLGSEDAETAFAAGDCEDHINQMRLELGLPIRTTYFFNALPLKTDPNFITRLVRLGFVETDTLHNRTKRYWLVWDAALVGGVDERSKTALIRGAAAN